MMRSLRSRKAKGAIAPPPGSGGLRHSSRNHFLALDHPGLAGVGCNPTRMISHRLPPRENPASRIHVTRSRKLARYPQRSVDPVGDRGRGAEFGRGGTEFQQVTIRADRSCHHPRRRGEASPPDRARAPRDGAPNWAIAVGGQACVRRRTRAADMSLNISNC